MGGFFLLPEPPEHPIYFLYGLHRVGTGLFLPTGLPAASRRATSHLRLHHKRHITKRTHSSEHRMYDRSRPRPQHCGPRARGHLLGATGQRSATRKARQGGKQGGDQETEEKEQREKRARRGGESGSSSNQCQRRRGPGLAPGNCFKILLMWTIF